MTPRRLRTIPARRRMVRFAGAYLLEHLHDAPFGVGHRVLMRTREALNDVGIATTVEQLVEYHNALDLVDGLESGRYEADAFLDEGERITDRDAVREGMLNGWRANVDLIEGLLVCA